MKVTGNKARVADGGKKIVQDITYSGNNGRQQTKVEITRDGRGGNPHITGIEKKSK
jgi:hypothetical protein